MTPVRSRLRPGAVIFVMLAVALSALAVGLLMCKYQTDRNTAFEVLRDHARSSRRKINEVADQLLAAEEMLNSLHAAFNSRLKK